MSKDHWEGIYNRKESTGVSWYRPHLDRSLALIEKAGLEKDARIVDIGAGASTLVDDLLDRGYRNVTVVDLSEAALEVSKQRLGDRAELVTWVVGDVTTLDHGEGVFDLWHDRAVFHFLTDEAQRQRYVKNACRALRVGGHIIVATFALDGPEKCSGLPVVRYSLDGLRQSFGDTYEKIDEIEETHETPWGASQSFVYCLCNKVAKCPS